MVFFLWQDRIIARLQQPYSLDCIPVEAEYQVVQTQNCETFKQIHWHTCYSLLLFFINDLWNLYLTSLFSWIIYFWLYFPKSQASLLQSTWWIRFTWPFFLGPVTRVSNCFFPWGKFPCWNSYFRFCIALLNKIYVHCWISCLIISSLKSLA